MQDGKKDLRGHIRVFICLTDMDRNEAAALHRFKQEVADAADKLYEKVPNADERLASIMEQLLKQYRE